MISLSRSKSLVAFLLVAGMASAQDGFEKPPVLAASEILRPGLVSGSGYKVHEAVPTMSGANRFTIASEYGPFQAAGNALLEVRIAEIAAIAKLKQVSKSDEYAKALANAAKAPIDFAERLVTDPKKTISDVPKGAAKLLGRIGSGVKEAVSGKGGSAEDTAKSAIGMESAKRQLAIELGVDPYSTNPVLQRELESVAWASFAGGVTLKVLLLPVGGGVGTAATVATTGADLEQVLKESSPSDLKAMNLEKLVAMKISKAIAEKFLANGALSPSRQTGIVAALGRLEGVKGREDYVKAAAENAEDEQDAVFWHLTAKMLADAHERGSSLSGIVLLEGGFPLAIAKDGTVVVMLHWDYACWTALAARLAEAVQKLGSGDKPAFALTISGQASPTLRKELESRGFRVSDRAVPGPLK